MRLYQIIVLGLLIGACTVPQGTTRAFERKIISLKTNNPVYKAVQFNGMHERTDRQELKAYTGVDPVRTEWCAAFVNAVLDESGIPSNSDHTYPYLARSFLEWGVAVDQPKSGDLVIFPRGSQGWQGHVGFFVSEIEIDGVLYYHILGGNQNNKVSIELYRANSALGIRRQTSA